MSHQQQGPYGAVIWRHHLFERLEKLLKTARHNGGTA